MYAIFHILGVSSWKLVVRWLLSDRVEVGLGAYVEDTVRYDAATVDRSVEFDGVKVFHFFGCFEDDKLTVFVADVDFAVDNQRRAPDATEGFILPVMFSCVGVDAVDLARILCRVYQVVSDSESGDGATDAVI